MTAQSTSGPSGALRQTTTSSSTDSMKSRRPRTKHACDECRRSQKKCDGDKPLCRRCYLNGTQCAYTPHKSRSQCACTDQAEEARMDVPVPDVFIFSEPSVGSFHTWSAKNSPDQSPTQSGLALEFPQSTNLRQEDRLGEAQETVLEQPIVMYEEETMLAPTDQRNSNIFGHRSQSLPNVSGSPDSQSPPTAELSPYPMPASLTRGTFDNQRRVQDSRANLPAHSCFIRAGQGIRFSNMSSCDQVRHPPSVRQTLNAESIFNAPIINGDESLEMYYPQQRNSLPGSETSTLHLPSQHGYNLQPYTLDQAAQYALNTAPLSYPTYDDRSANVCSGWALQGRPYDTGFVSLPHAMNSVPYASQQAQYYDSASPDYTLIGSKMRVSDVRIKSTELRSGSMANLPHPRPGRQSIGIMPLSFSSPYTSQVQWGDEQPYPPLTGSYPASANTSPSLYGTNDFYDW